jgi:hypothetical protein
MKPGDAPWHHLGRCVIKAGLKLLVFVTALVAFFTVAQPAQAHDVAMPAAVAAPTAFDGLLVDEALCGSGYRIPGTDLCTHGPDDPPAGAVEDPDLPLAPPPIVCIGNGVDGKRVQVMYVRMANTPDRYDASVDAIRAWAAGVDAIFDRSAHATGGHRHVRFVTNENCQLDVLNTVLPAEAGETFTSMIGELRKLGFASPDRKYLMFVDANLYCGIGTAIGDASPGPENRNNEQAGYARVDASCWGSDTAAHELTHTLGGVQHSAPNASGGWHCTDEYELMFYSDPPHFPAMAYPCPLAQGLLLDCNNDDYYHTNPPPDSYLATHWNVANSAFLTAQQPPNLAPAIALATPGDVHAFVAPARIHLITYATDSDGSVVKVEFYEGATLLATITAAPFVFTWEGAPAGSYVITATVYDDDGASANAIPLNLEVATLPNTPPGVTLIVPENTSWTAPAAILITATAADPDGEIARVEFYSGETLLASDDVFPYAMTWQIATGGVYPVVARAYDNAGASTTSSPRAVTVTEPDDAPPVVHLSMVAAATVVTTPMTITLSADVTTTNASVARVDFYADDALLGSDVDAPYTLEWRVEINGAYTLTAQAYDTRGLSAMSPPLALVVAPSENLPVDGGKDDEEPPNAYYLPLVVGPGAVSPISSNLQNGELRDKGD